MFRHPKKAYPKIASAEEWQLFSYSTLTVLQSSIARWAFRVLSVLSRRSGSLTEDLLIWKMLAADLGRFFRPFGAEHMHTHPRIKPPHWENVFNPSVFDESVRSILGCGLFRWLGWCDGAERASTTLPLHLPHQQASHLHPWRGPSAAAGSPQMRASRSLNRQLRRRNTIA